MGVHIDEPWRQHPSGRVDDLIGMGIAQVADGFDPAVENGHVRRVRGAVAAIDDRGVADQRVVLHVSLPAADGHRRHDSRRGRA
ncbi:hypothetical protein D3C78_1900900 [compost metagenome]